MNQPFRFPYLPTTQAAEGLARLRERLAEPKRAIDVFDALFARPIDDNDQLLGMATGESLAHLNCLLSRGLAMRTTDENGVDWYQARA